MKTEMNNLPSEPGFYWWRKSEADRWAIVEVLDVYAYKVNDVTEYTVNELGGQWQRCIHPDEETHQRERRGITHYRPPSIDRLEQVTLKECPVCGSKSPELIGGHYVKCRFKTCDMIGPRKDPHGHKWNSIPRQSEVRDLLWFIDMVGQHQIVPETGSHTLAGDINRMCEYANKLRKELKL